MNKYFRPFFSLGLDLYKSEVSTRSLLAPGFGLCIKMTDKVEFIGRYTCDMDKTYKDYQTQIVTYDAMTVGMLFHL
jgi:hypothetical protein